MLLLVIIISSFFSWPRNICSPMMDLSDFQFWAPMKKSYYKYSCANLLVYLSSHSSW